MPSAQVIRAPMGIGKTTVMVHALNQAKGRVEIYVPTHTLANELLKLVQTHVPGRTVGVIAGRSHLDATGQPLCRKHQLAQQVASSGAEVFRSLCQKKSTKRGKVHFEECQHFKSCPYLAQFAGYDITIYPHAYLPLQRSSREGPPPDVAVIDESFFNACIDITEIPIAELRSPALPPKTSAVVRALDTALTQGQSLLQFIQQTGLKPEELIEAKAELGRKSSISPSWPEKMCRAQLPFIQRTFQIRKLLSALQRDLILHRDQMQSVTYDPEKQLIRVHLKKFITRFTQKPTATQRGYEARVLIIDGSADQTIIRNWFRVTCFESVSTPRRARVVQCHSTRCSTASLSPKRNHNQQNKRSARKRLKELQAFVEGCAKQHGKVLVVGPQAITGNPKSKVPSLIKPPNNVDLAHFNAVRGSDKWKDFDAVIVVGRNQPPIREVESIARCVFQIDRGELEFSESWVPEPRGYRYEHRKVGTTVEVHPDQRIQSILEQMRERESEQTVDRLRLVHATTPKTVYLLSNIPLDIDVDELVSWDVMMNGSRFTKAWESLHGVMPLEAQWLHQSYPQLWSSPSAAKADIARLTHAKELQISNNITIGNLQLFVFRYRPVDLSSGRPRQRAWSLAVTNLPVVVQFKPELERLIGTEVVLKNC